MLLKDILSFQVVSGRFLLVVGRFRSFLARCRLFQVVIGRFRSFRVLVVTILGVFLPTLVTFFELKTCMYCHG